MIEAVLQSIAPRAARPTEIRNLLRREQGVALAFTSIRHALGQLQGVTPPSRSPRARPGGI